VKNELPNATSGGMNGETSTPDTEKCMSGARQRLRADGRRPVLLAAGLDDRGGLAGHGP
jgi:hypothetical protein